MVEADYTALNRQECYFTACYPLPPPPRNQFYLHGSHSARGLNEGREVPQNFLELGFHFRKKARADKRASLEEMSECPSLWLQNISSFVRNEQMVTLLNRTIQRVSKGETVPAATSRCIMIWLAGALLHFNAQRRGAVANATLKEYDAATISTHGRETYKSIMVSCHKTGTTGRAKLTADSHLSRHLDIYVQKIRPTLEGIETGLLFPNREGKPIDHLSWHISRLAKTLRVDIPKTATETRHATATAVADKSEAEREKVATAMSHSVRT